MLVVGAILLYFAIAALILFVFRGLTRRNRLWDRMIGPTLNIGPSRRKRRAQVPTGGPPGDDDFFNPL